MSELTPTRSLAIALADERRTMREGHAFLDEKCVLLAGAMLRELQHWRAQRRAWQRAAHTARAALRAALARHGLHGLQVYPASALATAPAVTSSALLGVTMQEAALDAAAGAATAQAAADAAQPSPEAEACRRAFAALLPLAAALAARSGNLARLHAEYRRTVRRVRALQDVLLPEIEATLAEIETSLEGLEQDEAAVLRRVALQRG